MKKIHSMQNVILNTKNYLSCNLFPLLILSTAKFRKKNAVKVWKFSANEVKKSDSSAAYKKMHVKFPTENV